LSVSVHVYPFIHDRDAELIGGAFPVYCKVFAVPEQPEWLAYFAPQVAVRAAWYLAHRDPEDDISGKSDLIIRAAARSCGTDTETLIGAAFDDMPQFLGWFAAQSELTGYLSEHARAGITEFSQPAMEPA
jgi:hypothetical protein